MPISTPWLQAALDPPRAFGPVLGRGLFRSQPEDFLVEEDLGFAPSGSGQHWLLKVRKRNANTEWVARRLAALSGCRPLEVGYAGLKDRRAVATQWFSVPRSRQAPDRWESVREPDFEVLEAHAHSRKLPRGALAGNEFSIRIRGIELDPLALSERLLSIRRRGVPNYFGPQRFGRDGSNLERIGAGLVALTRSERGFVLSAARSLIFNQVLAARLRLSRWERLEPGDLANLDGRGSFFAVTEVDEPLQARCEQLEIHPTGPMWGRGLPPTGGAIADLEVQVAATLSPASTLLEAAAMEQERRSLRLAVRDIEGTVDVTGVLLRFRLARGSYATAVLREIFDLEAAEPELSPE